MAQPVITVRVRETDEALWLRAFRSGELLCHIVEPEFRLDAPESWECASVHDGDGRVARLTLDGSGGEVSVRLEPVRILVSTLEYSELDRSASFRELSRRMAELDFDQEGVGLVDFEVWHLLPTAAMLFRDTPADRLPKSYAERVRFALDTVQACSGAVAMFELVASTWAQHWLGDDAAPPTLESLGAEVLPRVRERLGGARFGAALQQGARKVRLSREPMTIVLMNVGDDIELFRGNAKRIAGELERRGVGWAHHAERTVVHGDVSFELGEWLSEDLVFATLWDPVTQLAFIHFESPRGLQMQGVHALARKLGSVGLTKIPPERLAQFTHAAAWVIDSTRTRAGNAGRAVCL